MMMFFKEENFKVVEADGFKLEIPKGWEVVRLGEMAEKVIDSPHKMPKRTSKGYPFVSVNYVLQFSDYNFYVDPNRNGLEYIPEEDYEEFKKRFDAEKGDIIYTKWGTPGVAKLINTSEKFIGSCSVALIKLKKDAIIPLYLVYSLNSQTIKSQIIPYSHTSTRTEIHIGHIKKIKIPLPPLPEQQKIAHVLMSIDKAIEAVDEAIKQAERIKKGLMQELLTKGIGHKEFKDTETGRIPEDWEVVRLGDITEINVESINPPKETPAKEYYYIEIDSIQDGKIKSVKRIIGKKAPSRARRVVRENDVIMSTVRPYLKAFALVPKKYDGQICSTGFAVLRCKKDLVIPEYLLYNLFMDRTIEQCNRLMVGGQYPALNQSHVEQLKIPLPPLQEQQKIAEILSKWDEVIELKKAKKERLERMKKKAMKLLLTGKVRVK